MERMEGALKGTILIVEDNAGLADVIADALEEQGYRTQFARTGRQAVQILDQQTPDLVILDYILPDMRGSVIGEALHRREPAVPFVVITGHGDERIAVEMMKAGARDYLIKDATLLDRFPTTIGRILHDLENERKLQAMENALHALESRYVQALEAVNDGLWEWDVQSETFVFSSPRVCEMRGYTGDGWDYRAFFTGIHPDDQPVVQDRLREHLDGRRESFEAEYRYGLPTGDWVWILSRGRISERDRDGRPARMIGTDTDVTARKRVEESLHQSETRYRTLIESAPFPVMITRRTDHTILYYNSQAAERLGTPGGSLIGHTVLDLFDDPQERDQFHALLERDGKVRNFELRLRLPQEEVIWVYLNASLIVLGGEEAIFGAFNDITARKKAEEALRASESKYRFMTEKMNDIVWTLDLSLRTTYVSPSGEKVLGFTTAERMAQRIEEQVTPATLDMITKRMAEELEREQSGFVDPDRTITMEVEYYHKDGSTVWMENVISAIRDAQGALVGIHGVSRDISERMRAEQALSESERRFRTVADFTNDWEYWLDPDGKVIYMSPSCERITGYHTVEFINRPELIREIIHPDDRARVEGHFGMERPSSQTSAIDFRILRRDGQECWIGHNCRAVYDERDYYRGVRVSNRDITARKQAEQALQAQLKFTETLFETIASPVFSQDNHGLFLSCNRAFADFLGLAPAELVGKTIFDLAPRALAEVFHVRDEALLETGATQTYEFRAYHYGRGQECDMLTTKSVFNDSAGKPAGIVGVMIDITEQKQYVERLRLAKQDWERTFDAVSDFISIIDNQYRIIRVNKAMSSHLGMIPAACINQTCYPLMHKTEAPPDFCPHTRLIESGHEETVEFHDDLTGKDLLVTCSPLRDENGILTGCVHVARDITAQKLAEAREKEHIEQLMQADKMVALGTLVSGVAHEINNPNNFILLNAKIIAQAWADAVPVLDRHVAENSAFTLAKIPYVQSKGKIAGFIDGIVEGSLRIKNIVQSLKDFSRPEKSDIRQLIDVNMVVRSSINLLSNLIEKSTRAFIIDYDTELPHISGNFQRLEQVVINLIQNACESLPEKTKGIAVATAYDRESQTVQIRITDEGVGIEKKDQKYIMNPFFTTKRDFGGTGLGLSITARIIEDHRGTIQVSSEPGRGTTVTVNLPVHGSREV